MSKVCKTLFICTAVVLIMAMNSFAYDDGDFQYWNNENVTWEINKEWKAKLEEEFRFGDDASDFYYQHTDLGFTYSGFVEWVDVGLNYRGIFEEKSKDWKYENRPHLNLKLKTSLGDVKVSNNNRFEFRIRQSNEDKMRYRNKSTVKPPIKFSRFEIQPYLTDEIFLDTDSVEMTRNRLYIGFNGKVWKNFKADIFYVLESNKSSDNWADVNVFGTKISLSF
jgi:hypothetical protein